MFTIHRIKNRLTSNPVIPKYLSVCDFSHFLDFAILWILILQLCSLFVKLYIIFLNLMFNKYKWCVEIFIFRIWKKTANKCICVSSHCWDFAILWIQILQWCISFVKLYMSNDIKCITCSFEVLNYIYWKCKPNPLTINPAIPNYISVALEVAPRVFLAIYYT